jgi:glycerol-3-phosphate dehydrogenase
MGEVFDETLSEKELPYLRDHEWAGSVDAMLQRRTKTALLASPSALTRIRAAVEQILVAPALPGRVSEPGSVRPTESR